MSSSLVITNARIWTGWPAHRRASTLVIREGVVVAVDGGDDRPASGDPAARHEAIDAGGRTIIPGLIDSHLHLVLGARSLGELDLAGARSRAEFEQLIARRHAELPHGAWLVGHGWAPEHWPGAAMPDKRWLEAAGDRPVVCHRSDHHAVLVNDAVLERGGLEGPRLQERRQAVRGEGRIERDPSTGEPTGLFVESAAWKLINPLVPAPTDGALREAVLAAQRDAHGMGLTTVGTMEYRATVERVLWPLRAALTLRCRVTLLDREEATLCPPEPAWVEDDRVRVIGYKAFLDGTLGSRTARMLEPYADEPGSRGLWLDYPTPRDLEAWAAAVTAAGFSPSMHAIGDAAVRRALDVTGAVRRQDSPSGAPARTRPRIEHAQHVHPDDLARFRDVVASMQPLHKAVDGPWAGERLGAGRVQGAYPFRSLLEAGAVLAFGSDWPIVSCDPLAGVRAAVTGCTVDGGVLLPEQNLSVEEALSAYTAGAAAALGLDDAGVLRPGARGDLVLLDRDPFEADWVDERPRPLVTIVAGEVVHDVIGLDRGA